MAMAMLLVSSTSQSAYLQYVAMAGARQHDARSCTYSVENDTDEEPRLLLLRLRWSDVSSVLGPVSDVL